MRSMAGNCRPWALLACSPPAISRRATPTLSSSARMIRFTSWVMASSCDQARHLLLLHHLVGFRAIAFAHVACRRPTARGWQADQLHAELVKIAIAAGILLLDLHP